VSFALRVAARARRVAAAAALCLAVPAATAHADEPLPQIAERYRRGDRDAALAAIAARDPDRVAMEVDELIRQGWLRQRSSPPATEAPPNPQTACAVVVLLTHRALLGTVRGGESSGHLFDGATRMLLAIPRPTGPPQRELVLRKLFLLVSLALHAGLEVARANEVARVGLQVFKDDPELLVTLGLTLEVGPSQRQYDPPPDAKPSSRTIARSGFTVEGAGSRGEWRPFPLSTLGDAEASFRRALAFEPGLPEARLRLGRVLLLKGEAREALDVLQPLALQPLSAAGGRRRLYLARLFEARAQERLGDVAAAAYAYRAAVEAEPNGQSAWIGLGRAQDLLGRRDEAQEAFAAALGPEGERGDPWWSYALGDLERFDPLIAEIQAALAT
jgi:hypothetical protein